MEQGLVAETFQDRKLEKERLAEGAAPASPAGLSLRCMMADRLTQCYEEIASSLPRALGTPFSIKSESRKITTF